MQIINKLCKELDLTLVDEGSDGVHILKSDILGLQFICPHSGTYNKYLIRAEFLEIFDKYSLASFQEFYSNEEHLEKSVEDLKKFIENKEKYLCEFKKTEIEPLAWSLENELGLKKTEDYIDNEGRVLFESNKFYFRITFELKDDECWYYRYTVHATIKQEKPDWSNCLLDKSVDHFLLEDIVSEIAIFLRRYENGGK